MVEISFVNQSLGVYNSVHLFERFQYWQLYIPEKSESLRQTCNSDELNNIHLIKRMNFLNKKSKMRKKRLSPKVEDWLFQTFSAFKSNSKFASQYVSYTHFIRYSFLVS